MLVCYLGVGSNLGDRSKNINLAYKEINRLKGTKVIKSSRMIETKPVGGPLGQGKFLNAVLKIKTIILPPTLLKNLKAIENKLGRPKKYIRYSPRIIDIDILLYANKKINNKFLNIPHPKIFQRDFVMRPLLEII